AGVFAPFVAAPFVWNDQAGALGEFLDRIDEFQAVVVHQEADRAAVRAAAKAVEELLGRADGEARGAFVVERAARLPVAAGFLQRHPRLDHLDNIDARQQFIDEMGGNAAGHDRRIVPRPRAAPPARQSSQVGNPLPMMSGSVGHQPWSGFAAFAGVARAFTTSRGRWPPGAQGLRHAAMPGPWRAD